MTYPPGGQGYPPSQPQSPPPPARPLPTAGEGASSLQTYLLGAVLVLGLIGYLLSFGPVYGDNTEYSGIRTASFTANFAVVALLVAGLLAAVAMLPKQTSHTGVVSVVALTGFLIAVLELITNADAAGWALIVIVIVGGLQALASIGALLLEAGVVSPPAPKPKYDQHPQQQYGGGYYGPPQGGPPQGQPQQQHVGQQLGAPQPQRGGQHAAYPQYGGGGYQPGPSSGGYAASVQHSGPPTPPTGFPAFAPPPSQAPGPPSPAPGPPSQAPGPPSQAPGPPSQAGGSREEPPTQHFSRESAATQQFSGSEDQGSSSGSAQQESTSAEPPSSPSTPPPS